MEPYKYTKKLIKLGKHSKALIIPLNFLKKFSDYPQIKEAIIEEYSDKLIIKFEEVKNGSAS